jgi:hypothetical protein
METDLKRTLRGDDDDSVKKKRQKSTTTERNKREKKLDNALSQVLYCLQPSVRSNITVFNLNSENDLAETIFGSICKCKLNHLEYSNSFLRVFHFSSICKSKKTEKIRRK